MVQEASLEFRLTKVDRKRNYLLDEIKHIMSEKYKKTCKYSNYVKHLLILVSRVTGCVSISAYASLVCVPVGITGSTVGIKICIITAGIEKYKSTTKKKKKKKHEKIVLLGKYKLNAIEVLISKALIDSYISNEECISVNYLLREYNEIEILCII